MLLCWTRQRLRGRCPAKAWAGATAYLGWWEQVTCHSHLSFPVVLSVGLLLPPGFTSILFGTVLGENVQDLDFKGTKNFLLFRSMAWENWCEVWFLLCFTTSVVNVIGGLLKDEIIISVGKNPFLVSIKLVREYIGG